MADQKPTHRLTRKSGTYEVSDAILDRAFWPNVDRNGPNGCWTWTGRRLPSEYGTSSFLGQKWYAHRISYEVHKGLIPEGLHIDHLCRNRSCCNPEHLEAVTCRENIHRSPIAVAAINAAKTHCVRGHAFTPENTGWNRGRGWRYCLTCRPSELPLEPGSVPAPVRGVSYGQAARPGATFATSTGWRHRITDSDMGRFWRFVKPDDRCWAWTGHRDRSGYGTFNLSVQGKQRTVNSHRFAYTALVASPEPGRWVEQLCRERGCVNPAHLVAVTVSTNHRQRWRRERVAGGGTR